MVWQSRTENDKQDNLNPPNKSIFAAGISRLKKPALPLVNMVQFLYLTGPFTGVAEVLKRLTKAVELQGILYENPGRMLEEFADVLQEFEVMKGKKKVSAGLPFIIDEKGEPLAKRPTLEHWIRQQVLSRELAVINSLLCGPCGCVLCCTGPNSEFDEAAGFKGRMRQEFFEIPLGDEELDLCNLRRIDTEESRRLTTRTEPPLQLGQVPFFRQKRALYHWKNGWSLILPAGSACPQLAVETRRCLVYEKRPAVCRKPQIFAFILEKTEDTAKRSDGALIPVYMARNKILAVWDCPYVRSLQQEIAAYAEFCGLEPVFRKSKT